MLGVTPVTVSNWERGHSVPRGEVRARLERLMSLAPSEGTDDETLLVHGIEVIPAPYVVNGPADQRDFHNLLIQMQTEALRDGVDPRGLSLVSQVRRGDNWHQTSQSALESPKRDSKSWRGTYGLHGIHRYVGRFPPHVVRALLVSFGMKPGALVLDPFLGSGTTTLEARLLGYRSFGIELNPLSVLISRCKSQFPNESAPLQRLLSQYATFYDAKWFEFVARLGEYEVEDVLARPGNSVPAFANVSRWFTPEALLGVSITIEFAATLTGYARDLVLVALSSQMRSIGNVDVDVVRAEYRKAPRIGVDVKHLTLRALRRNLTQIDRSVATHSPGLLGPESVVIEQGSVLDNETLGEGEADCIITSPPYGVESLSYLRTHLLSYRTMARDLGIDAYDWNDGVIGSEYLGGGDLNPQQLRVTRESPTFREFFSRFSVGSTQDEKRRDMMMQFFEDMSQVVERMARWLKPRGQLAFVIGNKSLRGEIIPTDEIMLEIFAAHGLSFERAIRHKLKTNNSNSSVPWQDRTIAEENILMAVKR